MPELRQRYKVRSLGLFGSYVRNEQKKGSDVDLLVEFDEIPSLFDFVGLEMVLTQLLDVKVDLVMKDALKPSIGRNILDHLVPISS